VVDLSLSHGLPTPRQRIGIDTNIFIYFLEGHPRYGAWCASLFELIERGQNSAVTATVTLLELLVQPYRDEKDDLAHKIFSLTSTHPKLEWVPLTMNLADRAAQLRARYRLSTPDAIQLAAAISQKAVRFYGNDRGLRRVNEIECIILDDLV
jgi:predicted nucleic acid-binding protein